MPFDTKTLLEACREIRVLVIGDIMLDHYLMGDAARISPEAPVPVVSVGRDVHVPGGAANVACNLAGLGIRDTQLLGSFGDDAESRLLRDLLARDKIELHALGKRDNAATILKTRVIVRHQQLCRLDREGKPADYHLDAILDTAEFRELIAGFDAILFSDYAKGTVNDALLRVVRETARNADTPPFLAIDPKPRRKLDLAGMDLMTPNRTEALQLAGFDASPDAEFEDEAVCEAIFETWGPRHLVVTLGDEGMLLGEKDAKPIRLETEAQEVFDVSGAGDTVAAVLTSALATGHPLISAASLANRAAGVVVSHLGTAPIRASELSEL
ncbi:MAG: bifunctional heptose 7-phosphate kinase/heptose 1-phosphate adenyltransferase [Opitutales bacterium]